MGVRAKNALSSGRWQWFIALTLIFPLMCSDVRAQAGCLDHVTSSIDFNCDNSCGAVVVLDAPPPGGITCEYPAFPSSQQCLDKATETLKEHISNDIIKEKCDGQSAPKGCYISGAKVEISVCNQISEPSQFEGGYKLKCCFAKIPEV